jgi:hypothetical protein
MWAQYGYPMPGMEPMLSIILWHRASVAAFTSQTSIRSDISRSSAISGYSSIMTIAVEIAQEAAPWSTFSFCRHSKTGLGQCRMQLITQMKALK